MGIWVMGRGLGLGAGILLAALLATALPGSPRAQEAVGRILSGAPALTYGGVAALYVGDVRSCSAVRVAPDEALTAAHCVQGRDPATVSLFPGLGQDQAPARRQVTAIALAGDQGLVANAAKPADLRDDLALLILAATADSAGPLAHPVRAWPDPVGEFADILGYEKAGPDALTLREGCAVLAQDRDVVTLACDVVSGLSGAAVFRQAPADAQPELVAIISSRAAGRSYALVIAERLEELRAMRAEK